MTALLSAAYPAGNNGLQMLDLMTHLSAAYPAGNGVCGIVAKELILSAAYPAGNCLVRADP